MKLDPALLKQLFNDPGEPLTELEVLGRRGKTKRPARITFSGKGVRERECVLYVVARQFRQLREKGAVNWFSSGAIG